MTKKDFAKFEGRAFGRTILDRSGVSKKELTKSHDFSRLFSKEKCRLKISAFAIGEATVQFRKSPVKRCHMNSKGLLRPVFGEIFMIFRR